MNDPRIVLCDHCGSEGRVRTGFYSHDQYGNEMLDERECPSCEGTGGEIIETQPIDMRDLDIMAGEAA